MQSLDAMASPPRGASTEHPLTTLAGYLEAYRLRRGLDKAALSDLAHKSAPYYGQVVKGKIRPSYAALLAMLEALEVAPADRKAARVYLAAAQVEDPDLRQRVLELLPPGARAPTAPEQARAVRSHRPRGGAKKAG